MNVMNNFLSRSSTSLFKLIEKLLKIYISICHMFIIEKIATMSKHISSLPCIIKYSAWMFYANFFEKKHIVKPVNDNFICIYSKGYFRGIIIFAKKNSRVVPKKLRHSCTKSTVLLIDLLLLFLVWVGLMLKFWPLTSIIFIIIVI